MAIGFAWLIHFRYTYDSLVYSAAGESLPEHDDAVWVEEVEEKVEGESSSLSGKQVGFAFLWFFIVYVIALFIFASLIKQLNQPDRDPKSKGFCEWWKTWIFNPGYWIRFVIDSVGFGLCGRCGYRRHYCTGVGGDEDGEEGGVNRRLAKRRKKRKRAELMLAALSLSLGVAAEKVRFPCGSLKGHYVHYFHYSATARHFFDHSTHQVLGESLSSGLGLTGTLLLQTAVTLVMGVALVVHDARARKEATERRQKKRNSRETNSGLSETLVQNEGAGNGLGDFKSEEEDGDFDVFEDDDNDDDEEEEEAVAPRPTVWAGAN